LIDLILVFNAKCCSISARYCRSLKKSKGKSYAVNEMKTKITMFQRKRTKGQTMIYTPLHKKLQIEHLSTICIHRNKLTRIWRWRSESHL